VRFSAAVRAATDDVHRRAERTAFVGALLRGDLPRQTYAALVTQHRHLYDALEAATAAKRDDPVVAAFADPALERSAALEEDVAFWGEAEVLPPTVAWADRIREADVPELLAHHYVRYLGDLSGGFAVERAVRRAYGVTGGLAFHRFDAIEDPTAFKQRYRTLLDDAPWDAGERDRFVAEARWAYDRAAAVFDALVS
jgi:heme oxygenase (biliverdin-producing, ferredoxin)